MPSAHPTLGPDFPDSEAATERELALQVAPGVFASFLYACGGIRYAFRTQRNFRIHLFFGMLAATLGTWLGLSATEMAIVGLTIGFVLTMELLNTALESVVDLSVGREYHELAKVAKDCAAAAVLVSAIASLVVAAVLFLPALWISLLHGGQTVGMEHGVSPK